MSQVEIHRTRLNEDIEDCVIQLHQRPLARIALLPDGIFATSSDDFKVLLPDDVLVALVTVIIGHARNAVPDNPGNNPLTRLPGWPDLPHVICSHVSLGPLDRYRVRDQASAASLWLSRDPQLPVGWAAPAMATREVILGIGRMLCCHHFMMEVDVARRRNTAASNDVSTPAATCRDFRRAASAKQ
jgi:hypothetical protein